MRTFGLEDTLDLVSDEADWSPCGSCGEVSAQVKSIDKGQFAIKFAIPVNLPLESILALLRPEAASLWSHLSAAVPTILDSTMENHIGPGDAIVTIRNNMGACGIRTVCSLMARFQGWKMGDASKSALVRKIVRRNYPCEGDASIVALPLEDAASTPAYCGKVAIKLSKTNSGTLINEFLLIPVRFRWLLGQAVEQMCKSQNAKAKTWSEIPPDFISKAMELTHFVVLRLRKCARGPPLSPVAEEDVPSLPDSCLEMQDAYWLPEEDPNSFNLCRYLKNLLVYCGEDPDLIFDRIDGRRLIYFEAAVLGSVWSSLQNVVQPIMKLQSQAYRRHYGGTSAPILQVEEAPRFQKDPIDPDDYWIEHDKGQELPVKGTFIHFDNRDTDDTKSTWSI